MTENATKGLNAIKDYVKEEKIVILNLVETWLNELIKETANIDNYKIFRSDRIEEIKGGVAIYLYDKLEAKQICKLSHKKCEILAIYIPELQTINVVIYRPPKTEKKVFDKILNELEKIFQNMKKPEPTVLISGDFNFPFVDWNRMSNGGCSWSIKSKSNATQDEKMQFERLNNICEEQNMVQIIEEPTRERNTLDLMYTNEINIVTNIDVNKSAISDHSRVEISTTYIIKEEEIQQNNKETENAMRSLNFHNKRKIDWKNIVKIVKEMPWRTICDNGKVIEVIEYLLDKLYKVCIENMPKRNKGSKRNRIPREVKKLLNRIKMLRREKHKAYTKEKKKDIENRIFETEEQLIKTKQKKKYESERNAIDCMKENPKMLYSIMNKQKNRKK